MGWRHVTNVTNERTFIASVLPFAGFGNSLPLFFAHGVDARRAACLLGAFSSHCFDYVTRQKLGGVNMTFGYLRQFAVPPPSAYTKAAIDFIVPRVVELTYTAHDLKPFARDLGYDRAPFAWDNERRAHLRAQLDAYYAYLYGLTRDELRYILDPEDIYGADFPSETFRVLKQNETKTYDEYRTARLVLAAWDRLEAEGTFTIRRAA